MVEMSLAVRQKKDRDGNPISSYGVSIWNHFTDDDYDSGCLFNINFDKKEICIYDYADALEELFGACNNVVVVYRQPEGQKAVRVPDDAF